MSQPAVNKNYGHKIKGEKARNESHEKGRRQEEVVTGLQMSRLVSDQKETDFIFATSMKLCQGQVWNKEGRYLRIVKLGRLAVEYKATCFRKLT